MREVPGLAGVQIPDGSGNPAADDLMRLETIAEHRAELPEVLGHLDAMLVPQRDLNETLEGVENRLHTLASAGEGLPADQREGLEGEVSSLLSDARRQATSSIMAIKQHGVPALKSIGISSKTKVSANQQLVSLAGAALGQAAQNTWSTGKQGAQDYVSKKKAVWNKHARRNKTFAIAGGAAAAFAIGVSVGVSAPVSAALVSLGLTAVAATKMYNGMPRFKQRAWHYAGGLARKAAGKQLDKRDAKIDAALDSADRQRNEARTVEAELERAKEALAETKQRIDSSEHAPDERNDLEIQQTQQVVKLAQDFHALSSGAEADASRGNDPRLTRKQDKRASKLTRAARWMERRGDQQRADLEEKRANRKEKRRSGPPTPHDGDNAPGVKTAPASPPPPPANGRKAPGVV